MACDECVRLRALVRELREELAEWERSESEVTDVSANDLAAKIGNYPQTAKMLIALANARGKAISNERMCAAIGYEGDKTTNMLAQITIRARRCGFNVERIRSIGLRMPAEDCNKVLDMMK